MIETMIQKAEREAHEAETNLIHARAVLAAYPNAAYGLSGRFYARGVDVVGMEWEPGVGMSGGLLFFGEIQTDRGPARVYDRVPLLLEDMRENLSTFAGMAREMHTVAVAVQIKHEEAAVAAEKIVFRGDRAPAYLTTERTLERTEQPLALRQDSSEIRRPLPEQHHSPAIDPDATRA